MATADLLDRALQLASDAGYRLRQEWLDGAKGGACVIGGQKWLFVDAGLPLAEQLEVVLDALWADADVAAVDWTAQLEGSRRRAA